MDSTPRRRATSFAVIAALVLGVCAVLFAAPAPPAAANPPAPHDPIGRVYSVTAAAGGAYVRGWALDPDALSRNVRIYAVRDGRTSVATALTSRAWPSARAKYHSGPTPGYAITVPVASGTHVICMVASDIGAGLSTVLGCFTTPLGSKLSAAQLAAHSPVGAYTRATASSSTLWVRGWASDPDYVARRAVVVLYLDGAPVRTVNTTAYAAPRPAGAGARSAFDFSVAVGSGAHLACVWVVNIGYGSNSFLGCRAFDTRGPAGAGTGTTPALNKAALAQAKRHIGQAYVWAAAGPKTFDCSGLVVYSYAHPYPARSATAMTGIPHQSGLQFNQARLIPASRALPGDLVFYYDNEGDVYHVGIYVSPGRTVAAIDEAHGVGYQAIWDPAATVYGSFTHT